MFDEKYEALLRDFLNTNLELQNPKYGAVYSKKWVDTTNGKMLVVHVSEDIHNPDCQIIAECFINNKQIYLYDSRFWAIAVDKNDQWLFKETSKTSLVMVLYEIN